MKTYRQSLDELHFTREEKNAMVDRLTAGESRGSGKVRSIRRTVTVGVAAALLMTMGVGAAVTLTPAGEVFASIFGDSPAQTEIMDRMGVPIGASDTADGVTITADAIIGDTYSYAVVYSIARDDGQPLAENLTPGELTGRLALGFETADTGVNLTGSQSGWSYFFDADPTDNAVQFVEQIVCSEPLEPGVAVSRFQGLYQQCGSDFQEKVPLAEGEWTIRFQFDFPDSGMDLTAGQDFQLGGMEATLNQATISPLSFQVDYTVWEELVWDQEGEEGQMSPHDQEQDERFFGSLTVTLHFTDGTSRELTGAGGTVGPENGRTHCRKWFLLEDILDLSTVESVTVGDVTLPVEAE